jgi:SIT4-associating protein SAP185/190
LFANKSLSPETTEPAVPDTAVAEPNVSAESMDTTMGEAGDSSNSVMMENTDEQQQSTGEEPPAPVVGDFLKMQFVEHKVVPTILVSQIHARIQLL